MDPRVRALLHAGKLSWGKAQQIGRAVLAAPPGDERRVVDAALQEIESGGKPEPRYILTPKAAQRRLARQVESDPKATYTITAQDLYALVSVLAGKGGGGKDTAEHITRVRRTFPSLLEERD
jgi:hypothetical protein